MLYRPVGWFIHSGSSVNDFDSSAIVPLVHCIKGMIALHGFFICLAKMIGSLPYLANDFDSSIIVLLLIYCIKAFFALHK